MIVFDGVTKRYPDGTVAVDDLSLVAPTGKITVLVGPSGCGKTTSLRMVNRMIEPTPRLPLRPERTLLLGETPAGVAQDWALVVDDENRPLGWIEPRRVEGAIRTEMLHRGGTVAPASGPLRAALDAALSSPSRRGVIVDDSGSLVGTVRAHEVLNAIEEAARPEVENPANPGASAP